MGDWLPGSQSSSLTLLIVAVSVAPYPQSLLWDSCPSSQDGRELLKTIFRDQMPAQIRHPFALPRNGVV